MSKFLVRLAVLTALLPSAVYAVTHDVQVGDNFFSPNDLTITVGDTVRWSYSGSRQHDVTADDGSWASETSSNFVYERTFNSVGEVRYHCSVHSSPGRDINTFQNGRINVVQADNQAPSAAFNSNCFDLNCDFTDQSTDADGSVVSWSWNFGDGTSSTSQNPSHGYAAGGTYMVTLSVTDDDGAQSSISSNVTVNAPSAVTINVGMSDAWFNSTTSGQGFLITVWESIEFMFLAWFTYETERPPEDAQANVGEPGHRWLTAQGSYSGSNAVLDVFLTSGGVFDAAQPPAVTDQQPIGTITIEWVGCNEAMLSYDLPDLGLVGDVPIERIVADTELCEAGQTP
jgi:PKD repeat protein